MHHQTGSFRGYKDFSLFYQYWLPDGDPKTILLIVHGLAEHSGRYVNLVDYFVPRGLAVYIFDQRGHGRSEGRRGYVARFEDYLVDLKIFSDMVRRQHPGIKTFMVGHSIGGTVAVGYVAQHQQELAGLILSGATLKMADSPSAALIALARVLSFITPKMGMRVIDASAISRDKAVVDAYINDPMVYRGKISARLGAELINIMAKLPGQMAEIRLPLLIMQGTADRLSHPAGSQMLYERVGSPDKTLKLYEGFYHEIFNEPGHEQVFADMESWLNAHM
jgi:alpha-beta hydrolase superfamily lysophospholipase